MHGRHGRFGNFSLSLLTERLVYSSSKWRRYGKKSISLSRIYRRAVAMTLCFELQQSHDLDYVLRDEVYTRYLANTYFARKRNDLGCLYQIDLEKVIL